MRHKIIRNNQGVSLLEAIVSMGILLMIIGGIVALLRFGFFSRDVIWEQLTTQSEGRKIVQDFVNELRSANDSSTGAYPIAEASTTEIIFYSNIDSDSLVERVRYFKDGEYLKRGVIKPAGMPLIYASSSETIIVVAHDVVNTSTPVLLYFGEDYDGGPTSTPLSQPVNIPQVRVVRIQIQLEEKPNISPAPFFVEAEAQLRNLKSN